MGRNSSIYFKKSFVPLDTPGAATLFWHNRYPVAGYGGAYRHGEAVGYGMLVAAELAAARGALARQDQAALSDLIASLGARPAINDVPSAELLAAMKHDKKVVAGTLHFVLPTSIGSTAIVNDVTDEELQSSLKTVGFAG